MIFISLFFCTGVLLQDDQNSGAVNSIIHRRNQITHADGEHIRSLFTESAFFVIMGTSPHLYG